ncbi:MAG: hypothetical protein IJZ01_00075 [Paraprevotella sp.]|nr:hypothetical protein [Paraprevotella sp.]
MAKQLWHDISWEDKHLYSNVTSTSYGNPVQALYQVEPDGRPSRKDLTKAGLKHFGYEDEDKEEALEAEREAKRERKRERKEAEREAKREREREKEKDGCCPSSSLSNSICDSIIDSIPGLRCIVDCCC